MHFLDLPPELLTLCLSYLSGRELALVSQTCRTVRDIANAESVWQKRCWLEYHLATLHGWGCTYSRLYATVLYKYGPVLGLWRSYTTWYGGLYHVKYGSGCILAYEHYPTKHVRDPLKQTPAFTISIVDGEVVTQCLRGHGAPHPCDIHVEESSNGEGYLSVLCQDPDKFHRHSLGPHHEYTLFQADCVDRGTDAYLTARKWASLLKSEKCQTFMKLNYEPTHSKEKVPIQPGFFKGTYGAHGTEIVQLTYDDDKHEIHVRKITGDPNVPAGERSVCVDLTRPMILTERQQDSISLLRDIDIGELPCDTEQGEEQLGRQPFIVPHDCDAREASSLPDTCMHRYHSQGTVSPTGYRKPEQIVNHFIVLDNDTFAVLWLELYSLGLFSRVTDQFAVCNSMHC